MNLLPEIFLQRTRDSGDRDAFGQRSTGGWNWCSWGEAGERALAVAAALLAAGFRPGTTVGILSASRREWVEVEMGAMLVGGVVVPIHPATTGPAALDIVRRAGIRFAFAEEPLQAEKLLPALEPHGPLARIVLFDPLSRLAGYDARGRLEIDLGDLSREGAAAAPCADSVDQGRPEVRRGATATVEGRLAQLRPGDPATIVFNWSAAGRPLATVLTHDNLAFTTSSIPRGLELSAEDRTLLFLPLAHVYPRLVVWLSIQVGSAVGFAPARGEALRAAAEMHPDYLVVVPRFLERLRKGLQQEMQGGPLWRRQAMRWALDVGHARNQAQAGGRVPLLLDAQHFVADRLVHRALRERLGGRLRFIVSGGAPLDPDTARYFTDVGMPVLEGYGMTETTGLASFCRPGHPRPGTVGPALEGVELRIAEDGEILVRGRNVMHGYLDDETATAEIRDADGWLHSGDLGRLEADGALCITGRKKDVIVTEGGKNVSPLHLQELLRESPVLRDALVIGDRRPYLVALVVPDEQEFGRAAASEGILFAGSADVSDHPALRARLDGAIAEVNGRLDPFLQIRAYAAVHDLDAEAKTPRGRRLTLEQRYCEVIDRLYVRR